MNTKYLDIKNWKQVNGEWKKKSRSEIRKTKNKKESNHISMRWAFLKLRTWLKANCVDIDTYSLSSMKYCLDKYFQKIGRKKPGGKSLAILMKEYGDKNSPIFKGERFEGLTLKVKTKKEKRVEYDAYIKSPKWRAFRLGIIEKRGESCEKCKEKTS